MFTGQMLAFFIATLLFVAGFIDDVIALYKSRKTLKRNK